MPRTKLLIDCDPGHDDAVAILYAARHCDLLAITTVHGNNSVENVTRNALSVLTLAGLNIPVAAGCAEPLAGRKGQAADVHGEGGLEGADLPEPDRAPVGAHAVDLIIETARRHEGELVLAVIGPATNAAMALKREPRLAGWLREITVMGGSAGLGNITPAAEFNAWSDPEAAAVVYNCGAPVRMVGYDVTSRTGIAERDIARLTGGGCVAQTVGKLLAFYLGQQRQLLGLDIAPMHDVCAVVPYVQENLITYHRCHVAVELAGALTRGMTVCDLRRLTREGKALRASGESNVQLAVDADSPRLIDHVVETLLAYP
jgi:inosine-uridine nucleoside N-ribohydrolase